MAHISNKVREREGTEIGATADMLSVVALVLTVIYAEGQYDTWDVALSIIALILCIRRIIRFSWEKTQTAPRVIAQIGIALATYVLLSSVLEFLIYFGMFTPISITSPLMNYFIQREAGDVLLGVLLFGIVWVLDRLRLRR